MPGVLEAIRQKYPQYADVPDEKLGPAIAAKYPQYLERDPSLKRFSPVAARASASLPAPAGSPAPATPNPAATGYIPGRWDISTKAPASPGYVTDTQGFVDAFARGWDRLTQSYSQLQAGPNDTTTIAEERRGYEQAMQDPRYYEQGAVPPWQMDPVTGQPRNRARMARVEATLGPAGKTEQAARNRITRSDTAVADIAATAADLRDAPKSAGMEELAKAKTTAEKWRAWAKNPFEITSQIAAESLVQSAPAMVGMPVAGPAAVGAGSFTTELSNGILESAGDQGYDIADPKQLQAFLNNPKARAQAQGYALKRAAVIGTIDGVTAGAAGQILSRTLGKGMGKVGAGVAGEVALQAAGGAGGEALAQTVTGKPLDSFEIAMEAMAEVASAPSEVVSNLYHERQGFNGSPTVNTGPAQSLPTPSTEQAQTQGDAGTVGGGAKPIQPLPGPAASAPAPTSFEPDELARIDAAHAAIESGTPAARAVAEPTQADMEYAGGEMPRGSAVGFELPEPKAKPAGPAGTPAPVDNAYQAAWSAHRKAVQGATTPQEVRAAVRAAQADPNRSFETVSDIEHAAADQIKQLNKQQAAAAHAAEQRALERMPPAQQMEHHLKRLKKLEAEFLQMADSYAEGKRWYNDSPGKREIEAQIAALQQQVPQAAGPAAAVDALKSPEQSAESPPAQAAPAKVADSPDVLKWQNRVRALENRLETAIQQGHSTKPDTIRLRARLAVARGELKAAQASAAAPAKPKRVAKGFSPQRLRFQAETERGGEDVLSFIYNGHRLLSQTNAKAKGAKWWAENKSLYDDAVRLPPHHNLIYSPTGSTPDQIADAAFAAGWISEATPSALWAEIDSASGKRTGGSTTEQAENRALEAEAAQAMDWGKAIEGGAVRVDAGELAVGDLLEVEGERVEVTEVNTDSGWITLKDGRRFGVQKLPNDSVIYVEQWTQPETGEAAGVGEEGGDPFSLAEPESVEQQRERLTAAEQQQAAAARRDQLAAEAAAPLAGTTGDLGQGDLLAGPSDLFAPPTPKPSPIQQARDEARQAFKDWQGGASGGVNQQMFVYYGKLVKLAAVYAQQGVKTAAEFAAKLGIRLNAMVQRAWDDAQAGTVATTAEELAASSPEATSIKNATVARERAARWMPAAVDAARRGFGEVWDDAERRAAVDPDAAAALVAALKDKPRAVEDWEDALLLRRQIELQRLHEETAARAIEMHDATAAGPERLAEREAALARSAQISDQLLELYDVNKAVGTATARGLAARRIMAFEDYSLAKLELDKRTANEGRPITPEERAEIERLHQKVADLQRQLDAHAAQREARQAEEAGQQAVEELIEHATKQPEYDGKVLSLADRIVAKLNERADAARARLREKLMRASSGVDPTIIVDLAEIGAAKIAQGTVDFSRWSAEMVSEFGQGISVFLGEAWKRANVSIDEAVSAATAGDKKRAPAVRRTVRKQDVEGWRESIIEGIREAKVGGRGLDALGDYVRRLAESFVRGGIRGRDQLIDAVHRVLKAEVDPDITRREAMDAISGYGSHKPLDNDAIKVALRDLKGQMQQLAKLEDIQAREPLKKTGVERRTPSDEERRLIKQVNEAKRRFGVVVTDPATQLKGALDAIKTRLRNQIADLEYQLKTQQKIVKTRTPAPFDPEIRQLEAQRDALKAQFEALFPKQPLTEAQRAQAAERVLERSIAELEARVKAGDPSPKAKRPEMRTHRLDALRARREELKAQLQELRDALNPKKTPEERALSAVKARMATAIAGFADRMARGDFSPRAQRKVVLDAKGLELQAQLAKVKADWQRGLIKDRLARRTFAQKLGGRLKESLNFPRTVLSSWDVSAVLRQGGFVALGNPLRAWRNLGPMFKALASEASALRTEQEILSRPNAPLYARSKLYLAPHEALHLSRMEEQLMSSMADKVPGVKHSNRAYITFLNRLRADSFDALLRSVQRPGVNLTQAELEAIANYINIATGRGNLGKATAASETLATIFFSPRLMASRFQLLAGSPLYRGSWATRKAIAIEYAKFLGGVSVVLALGALAGAKIERDPRSADFAKLRFGNTRVDFLGGLQQPTVLLARLAKEETKNAAGVVKPLTGPKLPYGADTTTDVLVRFLRSKLSPVVSAAVNVKQGEDVVGQPVTAGSTAAGLLVPLTFQDIYEVMQEHGIARGTALGLLSLFGFGLQHYAPKPTAEERKQERARLKAAGL